MCVIAVTPPEKTIDDKRLDRLWTKNPDGGGFVWIRNGEIRYRKFMEKDRFFNSYRAVRRENPESPMVVHMRIATHGSVALHNNHPFEVTPELYVAHNGIIHGMPNTDPLGRDRSDTRMFIDDVLTDLPSDWLDNPYLVDMVEDWIGWSKLAFLSVDPDLEHQVYILNEKSGTWKDGIWFSNTHGVDAPKATTRTTGSTGTGWSLPSRSGSNPMPRVKWNGKEVLSVGSRVFVPGSHFGYKMPLTEAEARGIVSVTPPDERASWNYARYLQHARYSLGVNQGIIYNMQEDKWLCLCCEAQVQEEYKRNDDPRLSVMVGDCECLDMVCLTCNKGAQHCYCWHDEKSQQELEYWLVRFPESKVTDDGDVPEYDEGDEKLWQAVGWETKELDALYADLCKGEYTYNGVELRDLDEIEFEAWFEMNTNVLFYLFGMEGVDEIEELVNLISVTKGD